MKNPFIILAPLALACLTSACATIPAPSQEAVDNNTPTVPDDLIYTVASGDLLSTIALTFTGEIDNWPIIAAASGITDPKKMRVGQQLTIPGTLLGDSEITESAEATTSQQIAPKPEALARAPEPQAGADTPAESELTVVELTKAYPNKQFDLIPLIDPLAPASTRADYVRVNGSYFPKVVYEAPQLNAKLLMRVAPGTTLPIEKLDDQWYRVRTDQGSGFLRIEDGEQIDTAQPKVDG